VTKVPFILVSLALTATFAAAEPKGYVQAGLLATTQPAGTPNHRVSPALSGTTVGLTAAGGVFVTRTLAIEGEVVAGRSISAPQRFFYNWSEDYTAQSRDVFLVGNVRWRPAVARHFELAGGGGLALSTVANRDIVRTDYYPAPHTSPNPDEVEASRQPTLNGGVAAPLSLRTKIDVVPAFTVRWVKRPPYYGLGAYAGVGSYAYQVGATVRFTLD
jgi:hypothetical protein